VQWSCFLPGTLADIEQELVCDRRSGEPCDKPDGGCRRKRLFHVLAAAVGSGGKPVGGHPRETRVRERQVGEESKLLPGHLRPGRVAGEEIDPPVRLGIQVLIHPRGRKRDGVGILPAVTHRRTIAAGGHMGVLVIGDSHGTLPMVREALRLASQLKVGTVISVGDMGVWPGSGGKGFLDAIQHAAAARGVELLLVPGNHEDYDQIEAAPRDPEGWRVLRPQLKAAWRGQVFNRAGVRFQAFGGAASIDGPDHPAGEEQLRGPLDHPQETRGTTGRVRRRPAGWDLGGWWRQERITEQDVAAAVAEGAGQGVEVLITHEAPTSTPLEGAFHKPVDWPTGNLQRARVQHVVEHVSPQVVLSGHWHRFIETRVEGRYQAVLSADVNPSSPQWLLARRESGAVQIYGAASWSQQTALTALDSRSSYLHSKHRIDPEVDAASLTVRYP